MEEIKDFQLVELDRAKRVVTFRLPLHPDSKWGMNAVYSQSKHWRQRKKEAEQIHMIVRAAIRKQNRNARKFDKPVRVEIRYNSRLDIDNHGYLAKLIIDGMKGVLVEDDTRRYIKELTQGFHDRSQDFIFVTVEEI